VASTWKRTLSVGIVGAGHIVAESHLPVLCAQADVRPAWVTDLDRGRASSLARDFGLRAVELPADPRELPEADVVLLAIPHGARAPYYDALCRRDIALYVEKPVATTADEHRRIGSLFPEHCIAHGLQRRAFGPTRLIARLIGERPFGALRSVRFALGTPGAIPAAGFLGRADLAGGGILAEHGVHGLDTVLFVTRARDARVERCAIVREAGLDLHTEARIRLVTGSGDAIDFHLMLSWLRETRPGLTLRFEHAEISYSIYDATGSISVRGARGGGTYRLGPDPIDPFPLSANQTLHEHWRRVLEALRDECANETSLARSLLTTQVVEACYSASRDARTAQRDAG
jgi:predicted dehydrogenase